LLLTCPPQDLAKMYVTKSPFLDALLLKLSTMKLPESVS
jgi:hypothetical protein